MDPSSRGPNIRSESSSRDMRGHSTQSCGPALLLLVRCFSPSFATHPLPSCVHLQKCWCVFACVCWSEWPLLSTAPSQLGIPLLLTPPLCPAANYKCELGVPRKEPPLLVPLPLSSRPLLHSWPLLAKKSNSVAAPAPLRAFGAQPQRSHARSRGLRGTAERVRG